MRRALVSVALLSLSACEGLQDGLAPMTTYVSATDHLRFFPIGTEAHGDDCGTCHGPYTTFEQFTCLDGCHPQAETDPSHDGEPEYAYESGACLRCHPQGTAEGGAHHETIFPIADGTDHGTVACSECHADRADRSRLLCADCHAPTETTLAHLGVNDFAQDSALCVRCHADSQVNDVSAHGPFRIGASAPEKHRVSDPENGCLVCHPSMRADKAFGADFGNADCVGCHGAAETNPIHTGVDGYVHESGACLFCHPEGTRDGAVDHTGLFPIGPGTDHAAYGCLECHNDPSNRTDLACATCHTPTDMSAAHGDVGGFAQRSDACILCHADSQVHPVAEHLPFRISRGDHHREPCAECHPSLRADRPYRATSYADYDCRPCHSQREMDDQHDDEPGYAYVSTTCTNAGCHQDGTKP